VAGVTTSSVNDARDAEDNRLLEAGEHQLLVDGYSSVIIGRCRANVWPEAEAIAVAGDVVIRLLSELKRGRRYRVPFRVVVHEVIGWKIKEHFEPGKCVRSSSTSGWRRPPSARRPSPRVHVHRHRGVDFSMSTPCSQRAAL
jgi:hypothetical protein